MRVLPGLLSLIASACLLPASCAEPPPMQGKAWSWLGSLDSLRTML
jgi:hypothetical protein